MALIHAHIQTKKPVHIPEGLRCMTVGALSLWLRAWLKTTKQPKSHHSLIVNDMCLLAYVAEQDSNSLCFVSSAVRVRTVEK